MTTLLGSLKKLMLVELTYKQILRKVGFPIYAIPEELTFRDGLLTHQDRVIDDKNQRGDTLGKRRLQTPHTTYNLNKMCENFVALLKIKHKNFIDNKGNCFYYKKEQYTPIKPMKIKNKEYKGHYCRVWLVGHNSPFVLKSAPLGKEWAHVLFIENEPWQIYDFSEETCKSYRRMI